MEKNNTHELKLKNSNRIVTIDISLDEETAQKIDEIIMGKRKIETLIPAR